MRRFPFILDSLNGRKIGQDPNCSTEDFKVEGTTGLKSTEVSARIPEIQEHMIFILQFHKGERHCAPFFSIRQDFYY